MTQPRTVTATPMRPPARWCPATRPRRLLLLASLLALGLAARPAAAVSVQVDVTYSNCGIVSGPLSLGLTALPSDIHARLIFTSPTFPPPVSVPTAYPVEFFALTLGDLHVAAPDLDSFAIGYAAVEEQPPAIDALTYTALGLDSIRSMGHDVLNSSFALNMFGTDVATGQDFHYQCTGSTQSYQEASDGIGCFIAPLNCGTWAAKGVLVINEKTPGKEKVVAKWLQGPARTGTDFGNPLPLAGTAYTLCVYDTFNSLVGQYVVDRAGGLCGKGPCWKALGKPPGEPGHKGYKYKDKGVAADGALVMLLKNGEAGQSKVLFKGKNNAAQGQTALPTGVAAALAGSDEATIQLHGEGAAAPCVSVPLPTVKQNAGGVFKAKR